MQRHPHDLAGVMHLGIKLREANQQQQFNRNVEDIELWLYEMEGHLASDDYGKDLTSVQNLQKKHALLEADVAAHQVSCLYSVRLCSVGKGCTVYLRFIINGF